MVTLGSLVSSYVHAWAERNFITASLVREYARSAFVLVNVIGMIRGSTGQAEVEDVEGRRLFGWFWDSIASSTSDWRKARNRERVYATGWICVSLPWGYFVLGAWVSDWTEYIQITHWPGIWPGTAKSGCVGGGVEMKGTHSESSSMMGGWLRRPQGCCSRVREAR